MLTLLAYANSFRAGFVFDNHALLLEDTRLRALTASNLTQILHRPYWWPIADTPLYRPVTTFSYLVNYSLFGNADRPLGYHIVNWLLHTLNVSLVLAIVVRIGRRFWPAFFVAALWAVHPLGTEAVTNMVGRADLLAAFGVLSALYAHIEAGDRDGRARTLWTLFSVVAMTVAVFSKESAVAGLGVIVLYDLLWRATSSSLVAVARGWIVVALPVLLFLYERSAVLGAAATEVPFVDNPIASAGFLIGRLTALSVAGRYLALFVWPDHLSADYSFSQIPLASGTMADWCAWAAIAALAVATAIAMKVNRVVFFFFAAALITFLPASNLLFATGTIMAERLMYLPSAFLGAAIVTAIYPLNSSIGIRRFVPAMLGIAVVLCAARTYMRNGDWQDDLSLWQATERTAPASFKSHSSMADALYRSDPTHGNLDRVIAEEEQSLAILQRVPDPAALSRPYREAATYYLERADWLSTHQGDAAETSSAYRRAAALGERYLQLASERPVSAQDTSSAELLISAAYAHLQEGDKALAAARRAEADQPFNPMSYRATTAALLNDRRSNDAAIELMTGFMVTGSQDLRTALLDLYRGGLDSEGCAMKSNGAATELNTSCEMVRRHLCAAAVRAADVQRRAGHPELASQASVFTQNANCSSLPTP